MHNYFTKAFEGQAYSFGTHDCGVYGVLLVGSVRGRAGKDKGRYLSLE